ncbi:hypothetical protein PE067_16110 [Paracoccus sp. DMF-8]|uniref:hypothetical protein n=1 Tax=Paracoccus sp. DMF-8 TaxID=3019445 RepID=UPI0023E38AE6|nr:hypothetical protein [Paracoccus sp. DMF-8]MDF3607532.1 hypothetical protein [Paracoccus sp. DMF-8]
MNALTEIPPEDRPAGPGENWRSIGDLALAAVKENARQRSNAPGNDRQQQKENGDDQSY